jgi:hypothetical protein
MDMKKLLLVVPFLVGCSTASIEEQIAELPADAKYGCYQKDAIADVSGTFVSAAGRYQKNAIFCSENLPKNYCYKSNSGGVQVSVGDCK